MKIGLTKKTFFPIGVINCVINQIKSNQIKRVTGSTYRLTQTETTEDQTDCGRDGRTTAHYKTSQKTRHVGLDPGPLARCRPAAIKARPLANLGSSYPSMRVLTLSSPAVP